MDDRYETFCMGGPLFYDVLHAGRAALSTFRIAERSLPDGWQRRDQHDWFVLSSPRPRLPAQGWKIHVSACLDNAERVLAAVWEYCVPREIDFKFLRSRAELLARVSKYAPRGHSGKLVTIYPGDESACETILRELGEILDGEPNPYILSDLRWGRGPLYVRYGAFAGRYCVGPDGTPVPAIADPNGTLVPDRRDPVFRVPPWVTLPAFLEPHLAARNAVTVAGLPYTIDRVLHFSNGGGLYAGRDTRTGEPVVLKEGRPHAGIDAHGDDAVRRIEREHDVLQRLAGIPGIPAVHELFWLGEHRFLAMEFIDGRPLNRAIVARYPLGDSAAGPAEYARYTDWALSLYRPIESTVEAMHERGIVHGDLHLFNIMVRGEGEHEEPRIALLDFEVAAPAEAATRPGLGNPGFSPPPGTTGPAVDRYALACLRLALFLPMTNPLWLCRAKARHYAEIIAEHFPVPPEFLAEAVEVIEPGGGPLPLPSGPMTDWHIEPDPGEWPRLRDAMAAAIVASATPDRDDRLFPGDIAQFSIGGLGLAYGAAGVLHTLAAVGAGRYPRFEEWLLRRAKRPPEGTRLGLYDGLHGVAYVLDRLDHRQQALDLLDVCLAEKWESFGLDVFGGLSGIGLNLLDLADRTGEPGLRTAAERAVELVAERLGDAESVPETSGGAHPYAGLMRGSAGAALLLLRAFDTTGDTGYLDRAAVALRQDLRRCQVRDSGAVEVNEGWRTMPYLDAGSAGIGLVLDEYLARREDEQFATASEGITLAAASRLYALPGLFSGRAGILLYLAGRSPAPATDPLVARQVRGLGLHALPYAGGLAFPGTELMRLSMDLATGTAGVLLALGAALRDGSIGAPLLTPRTPARALPSPRRDYQTPAPTGAGQ